MSGTTAVRTIRKTVRPGSIRPLWGQSSRVDVFCKIEFDGERLSITGVEGPMPSGNARGSCGQIDGGYAHRDPADNDPRYDSPIGPEDFSFAHGWTADLWFDFLDVWKRWHLNDMRAECEHQRARGETYSTHPSAECPDCGYRLGSAWLHEDVPADVLDFLELIPETDRTPAWV